MTESPAPLYEVFEYNIDRLVELIVQVAYSGSEEEIRDKAHLNYLEGYLTHIDARTLVIEWRNIDRDFLEDYAAYYVRCFSDYNKICARIRVFNAPFDRASIDACLTAVETPLSVAKLQEAYLGFSVIKPLPQRPSSAEPA